MRRRSQRIGRACPPLLISLPAREGTRRCWQRSTSAQARSRAGRACRSDRSAKVSSQAAAHPRRRPRRRSGLRELNLPVRAAASLPKSCEPADVVCAVPHALEPVARARGARPASAPRTVFGAAWTSLSSMSAPRVCHATTRTGGGSSTSPAVRPGAAEAPATHSRFQTCGTTSDSGGPDCRIHAMRKSALPWGEVGLVGRPCQVALVSRHRADRDACRRQRDGGSCQPCRPGR